MYVFIVEAGAQINLIPVHGILTSVTVDRCKTCEVAIQSHERCLIL